MNRVTASANRCWRVCLRSSRWQRAISDWMFRSTTLANPNEPLSFGVPLLSMRTCIRFRTVEEMSNPRAFFACRSVAGIFMCNLAAERSGAKPESEFQEPEQDVSSDSTFFLRNKASGVLTLWSLLPWQRLLLQSMFRQASRTLLDPRGSYPMQLGSGTVSLLPG